MALDLGYVLVGPPRTESEMMIAWQVLLYRINSDATCSTDWRDVSLVHCCILETARQEGILRVTFPALLPEPDVPATAADSGDWLVDLEDWTQVNTQT
jgi:hypothetical protein